MEEQKCNAFQKDLAFFGLITASVTHEINNVFSIINELAGLLDDMTCNAEPGTTVAADKVNRSAQNIAKQISRGVSIVKRLNWFAHSMDEPVSKLEVNALLEDVVVLSQRFASLKKVQLSFNMPKETIFFMNSRFGVIHAIFLCIDLAMTFSEKKGNVEISCRKEGDRIQILIQSGIIDQNTEKFSTTYQVLLGLLKDIKGKVDILCSAKEENQIMLTISSIV